MRTRDGRTIWVRDETTFLHDEEGRPTYMQGVIWDVTERRLAEQALRESEQREREAAERLRALDEMKNTFLAAVSHELRSPLTSILGLSLTLERSELDGGRPQRPLAAPRSERPQARPAPEGPARHRSAQPRDRRSAVPRHRRGRARPADDREPRRPGRPLDHGPRRPVVDLRRPCQGRTHRREPADERRPPHEGRPHDLAPGGARERAGS